MGGRTFFPSILLGRLSKVDLIIHFSFNNNESSYVLGTSTLRMVDEERDLGVIIDKTLNQCTKVAAAANVVLGRAFNRKNFH